METLNPNLVTDIREGFFEEVTFKTRPETTGQRSGERVIQAEETTCAKAPKRSLKISERQYRWPLEK